MTKDDLVQATAEETLSPNGQLHSVPRKFTVQELTDWIMARPYETAPIAEAAAASNLSPEEIREIAEANYWIDVLWHDGGECVFVDGE